MDTLSIVVGAGIASFAILFFYCLFAFFDGQDNKDVKRSRIYLFFYGIGNKLYVTHKIKTQIKEIQDNPNIMDIDDLAAFNAFFGQETKSDSDH